MKTLLFLLILLSSTIFSPAQKHIFTVQGENFMLDGKLFIIRSGEMHYPRVPRQYWRDRFKKAKAMGLNTITTYIFWNLHEPEPGKFDFSGNLDVAAFVKTAQEEGLFVIVRPGPYICTEWEFGGIPAWLLRERDMKVRSTDARFLAANELYLKEVGKQLAPLQISNGGNIIMTQVENEYGSFGEDKVYMNAIKQSVVNAGFNVQLFTSDGPSDKLLKGGTLPEIASVINYGSGDNPLEQFEVFAKFRQNVPRMTGEYWIGWFDHWGEKHHTVEPEIVAKGVDTMLKNNLSFNLYMFHGGTTFGYMNGANYSRRSPYEPDTSAYDYDSPLDEAGNPSPKYFALREVIKKYLPNGETLPEVPSTANLIAIPRFELKDNSDIFALVKNPVASDKPLTMEDLKQNYGYVLYRKKFATATKGALKINSLHDYGYVYADGKMLGKLDRRLKEDSLEISLNANSTLDILVENGGRINFGKDFIYDRKGITDSVLLNNEELKGWENYSLPLSNPTSLKKSKTGAFYIGNFKLNKTGDTFLDMRGWGKGQVWLNGHHLGRFWHIGPQQTLFLPSIWLRKGKNEIIILDAENKGKRSVEGVTAPIYGN
jgi:beta-galactosidase